MDEATGGMVCLPVSLSPCLPVSLSVSVSVVARFSRAGYPVPSSQGRGEDGRREGWGEEMGGLRARGGVDAGSRGWTALSPAHYTLVPCPLHPCPLSTEPLGAMRPMSCCMDACRGLSGY